MMFLGIGHVSIPAIFTGSMHQQNLGHTTGTLDHYRPLQTTMDHYTVYGMAQGLLMCMSPPFQGLPPGNPWMAHGMCISPV